MTAAERFETDLSSERRCPSQQQPLPPADAEHPRRSGDRVADEAMAMLVCRTRFMDRLDAAVRHHRRRRLSFALLLLDLGGQDLRGEPIGAGTRDALLQECRKRLNCSLRGDDTAERLGTSRLAVVVEEIVGEAQIQSVRTRLQSELSRPILVQGRLLRARARIGHSRYPQDGIDPQEILLSADLSLARAPAQQATPA